MSDKYADGIAYVEAQTRYEREQEMRELRSHWSLRELSRKIEREEAKFYADVKETVAMRLAILAMENWLTKQKEKESVCSSLVPQASPESTQKTI